VWARWGDLLSLGRFILQGGEGGGWLGWEGLLFVGCFIYSVGGGWILGCRVWVSPLWGILV